MKREAEVIEKAQAYDAHYETGKGNIEVASAILSEADRICEQVAS